MPATSEVTYARPFTRASSSITGKQPPPYQPANCQATFCAATLRAGAASAKAARMMRVSVLLFFNLIVFFDAKPLEREMEHIEGVQDQITAPQTLGFLHQTEHPLKA